MLSTYSSGCYCFLLIAISCELKFASSILFSTIGNCRNLRSRHNKNFFEKSSSPPSSILGVSKSSLFGTIQWPIAIIFLIKSVFSLFVYIVCMYANKTLVCVCMYVCIYVCNE